jgi:transposase
MPGSCRAVDDSSKSNPPSPRKRGRPKGSKTKTALAKTTGKVGRPTKLTPQVRDAFAAHIRRGVWIERAASLVGIDKGNLYDWLKRGESETSGPHHDFRHAYERAQAEAEEKLSGFVFDAAEKDAKIALSILERKFPNQWGRRQLIAVEAVKPNERTTPFAFRVVGEEVTALPEPSPQDPEDDIPPPDEAA